MIIENKRNSTYNPAHKRKPENFRRNVTESDLYRELEAYQKAGISLWLNGRPSTSYGIANYVREEADYMRDYHLDQNNDVCGVGFDRIRKQQMRRL